MFVRKPSVDDLFKYENLRASMFAKLATVIEGRKPSNDAYDAYLAAVAGGTYAKPSNELTIEAGESPTAVKQDVGYGAKATGGLDDLEDIYSGRSGPGNDPLKEGGVKKRYVGGKRPSHMLFDSIADEEALCKLPRIDCPNCGTPARGLGGGQESYPLPSGQVDMTTGSPHIEQVPVLSYNLSPCGCRVNQEWAAAFTVELNNRKAGKPPKAVVDMSSAARAKKQKQLKDGITALYAARDNAKTPKEKQSVEYNLVIMIDQLMRLVPGAHNQITQVKFSTEVQKWAEKNKLKMPPSTEEPEPHGPLPKKLIGVDMATGKPWTSMMLGTWVPDAPSTVSNKCNLGSMSNPCAEISLAGSYPAAVQHTVPAPAPAKYAAPYAASYDVAAVLAALTDEQRKHLSAICSTMGITVTEALVMSKTHAESLEKLKIMPAKAEDAKKFILPPWIKKGLAEKLIDKSEMTEDMLAWMFPGGVPETRTLPKGPAPFEDPVKIAQAATKVAAMPDSYDKIRAQVKIAQAATKVAAMLDSYDKIRAQVAFLLPLLKKNRAYLTQLTRVCVVPGKTFSEAEEAVEAIGKNLQDFIDEKAPLSEHSSMLLTSFLANSDYTTNVKSAPPSPYQQYIDGSSVTPVAAPVSESLKEAMGAKAHKKAIEERREKAREEFHAKLERRPRKIRAPKPAEGTD